MSARRARPMNPADRLSRVEAMRLEAELVALQLEVADTLRPATTPPAWAEIEAAFPASPRKEKVTLRIDGDMLAWFRAQGAGWQTRVNAVLRAYMASRRSRRA